MKFDEEVKVEVLDKSPAPAEVTVDESKIDRLLHLLHEADPKSDATDSEEMLLLQGWFWEMFSCELDVDLSVCRRAMHFHDALDR